MPRKPTRRGPNHPLRHRPLTFSPFSRSMAIRSLGVRLILEDKSKTKDFPSSSGNGFLNNAKAEIKHSDSSDSEDSGVGRCSGRQILSSLIQSLVIFQGVKVLLQTYLDNKQWDLSGFVDLILGQPTVGTLVKIENDEDYGVYSIITALNMGRYKSTKCMIELKEYVCLDKDAIAKVKSFVGDYAQDVGLLVSQRVVNLPPQLLPPLYDSLFHEVEWATEDEFFMALLMSVFTMLMKAYRGAPEFISLQILSRHQQNIQAEKCRGLSEIGDEAIIYIKPEDEIFLELSMWSFSFPLHSQQVTTNELKNYQLTGLVMAIEASKVCMFRKQLHSFIDES